MTRPAEFAPSLKGTAGSSSTRTPTIPGPTSVGPVGAAGAPPSPEAIDPSASRRRRSRIVCANHPTAAPPTPARVTSIEIIPAMGAPSLYPGAGEPFRARKGIWRERGRPWQSPPTSPGASRLVGPLESAPRSVDSPRGADDCESGGLRPMQHPRWRPRHSQQPRSRPIRRRSGRADPVSARRPKP